MRYLTAILVLGLALPVSANLVENGGFEDGTNGWTLARWYDPSWATTPPNLASVTGLGSFGSFGGPVEGSRFLGMDTGGHGEFHIGAYQTIDVNAGETYDFTGWWAGGTTGGSADNAAWWEIRVVDGASSNPDDPAIAEVKNEPSDLTQHWEFNESFATSFVPAGSQATIFIKWGAIGSQWKTRAIAVDNLVVTPEPASLAFLALGGLALLRRRR